MRVRKSSSTTAPPGIRTKMMNLTRMLTGGMPTAQQERLQLEVNLQECVHSHTSLTGCSLGWDVDAHPPSGWQGSIA